MAVKASATITLYDVVDIDSTTWYYKLQSSTAAAPSVPTTATPSGWTTTEPSYTEGSTNTLYTVMKTTFSDGTFEYTPVSKSTSYEAAKTAYNKAQNAQDTANNTSDKLDVIEKTGTGGNLIKNGYGELLDNTNFSNGVFTRGDCPDGIYGYFTNGRTEKIPFNPNVLYEYEYYVRRHEGGVGSNYSNYFSIEPYDVDNKLISEHNVLIYNKNLFYLSEDLKKGDTVVHFTDLTNWRIDTTQTYQRSFLVFGYTDSTGYTYPDGTYSQKYYNNVYESNDSVDETNNTITLKDPWPEGTIPAGTCIGQSSYGSTYCYYGQTGVISNTEWSKKSGLVYAGELGGDLYAQSIRLRYAKNIVVNLYNNKADYCGLCLREKVIDKEASKVATNYMNFNDNGLVVGNMTANTLGNNVLIDSDSVDIRDGESVLASYGSDIILYNDNSEAFSIKKSSLIAKAMDSSDASVGYLKTTKTLQIAKGQSFKTQKEKTIINCDCNIDLTVNCPKFIVWHIQWTPQYSSNFGQPENLSDIDKNDYIFIQLNGFVTGG